MYKQSPMSAPLSCSSSTHATWLHMVVILSSLPTWILQPNECLPMQHAMVPSWCLTLLTISSAVLDTCNACTPRAVSTTLLKHNVYAAKYVLCCCTPLPSWAVAAHSASAAAGSIADMSQLEAVPCQHCCHTNTACTLGQSFMAPELYWMFYSVLLLACLVLFCLAHLGRSSAGVLVTSGWVR